MEKIKSFVKEHGLLLVLLFNIVLFFRTCGMNRDAEKVEKKLKLIETSIDNKSTLTEEQMSKMMERKLFDFLIYEDDIDKKKITLGQIKMKLDETSKK